MIWPVVPYLMVTIMELRFLCSFSEAPQITLWLTSEENECYF